jgi:hypothetical protein
MNAKWAVHQKLSKLAILCFSCQTTFQIIKTSLSFLALVAADALRAWWLGCANGLLAPYLSLHDPSINQFTLVVRRLICLVRPLPLVAMQLECPV